MITNVTVSLMFEILYPERDLNPQFLFRKLDFKSSVYTIPPPGYFELPRGIEPRYLVYKTSTSPFMFWKPVAEYFFKVEVNSVS